MGVQAVIQILSPLRPGDRGGFAGTAFETSGTADFRGRVSDARQAGRTSPVDEREAGDFLRHPVGDETRQPRSKWGRRAYDRRESLGFQLTLDPHRNVRHSTPFVAQLLDQAEATFSHRGAEDWSERAAAYDASNARAAAAYGVIESIEVFA